MLCDRLAMTTLVLTSTSLYRLRLSPCLGCMERCIMSLSCEGGSGSTMLGVQPEISEPMSFSHEHSTWVLAGARTMPLVVSVSNLAELMMLVDHHSLNWPVLGLKRLQSGWRSSWHGIHGEA